MQYTYLCGKFLLAFHPLNPRESYCNNFVFAKPSRSMSDYEKLVDVSANGLACLCFPNKARLTEAEITEIFSEYGNVVGINCTGNDTGFRFVRFRTKKEALSCAIALDGDPRIRLQPVKSRSKESNENSQQDQFTRNKRDNYNAQRNNQTLRNAEETDKADSTRGSQSPRKLRSNNFQTRDRDREVQNDFNNINHLNHANVESSKENFDNQRYSTNGQNPTMNHSNSRPAGNLPRTKELSNDKYENQHLNNRLSAMKLAQLHKLRGTNANTFQPSDNDVMNNVPVVPAALTSLPKVSSPPSSHHSGRGQSLMDVMPPLIANVPFLQSGRVNVPEKQIEVLHASDVIVANIHSNIGVSNIYHMFRKFSPIHVSDIETVPEINIRFCYVYFNTPKNALEVEQLFDGAPIHGQNLITLRPHRLEVESGVL